MPYFYFTVNDGNLNVQKLNVQNLNVQNLNVQNRDMNKFSFQTENIVQNQVSFGFQTMTSLDRFGYKGGHKKIFLYKTI